MAIEPAHAETFSTSLRHRGHGESAGSPPSVAGREEPRCSSRLSVNRETPAADGTNYERLRLGYRGKTAV